MTRERRFSLTGVAALMVALPLVAGAQTAPDTPKLFYACYGSLTGVVYRIKEPGLPIKCLHHTHVQFSWTSGAGGAAVTDHAALQGLGDDDHPQYLLGDGSRALTGALNAGNHRLSSVAPAATAGDAVPFEQAVKSGDAAGGDLSGTYPAPTVAKLQGAAVSPMVPANGQVLTFNGTAWVPAAGSSSGDLPCAGCVNVASIADGAVTHAKLAADVLTPVAFARVTVTGGTSCNMSGPHSPNVTACVVRSLGRTEITIEGEFITSSNYVTLLSIVGTGYVLPYEDDSGRLVVQTGDIHGAIPRDYNFVTFKAP